MQPNSIATVGFGFSRKKAPEPVYGSGVIEPPARHSLGDGGWVWEDAFGAGGAPRGAQALLARGERTWANAPHVSGGVPVVGSAIADEDETVFVSDFLGNTLLTLPGEAATTVAKGKRATTGFSYLTTALGVNVDDASDSASPRFIRLRSGGATPDRQGKPYDADLQAHVFPYRNYATALGRWTSADPLGFPDGPNRHFYAPVPTMGLDPLGLFSIIIENGAIEGSVTSEHQASTEIDDDIVFDDDLVGIARISVSGLGSENVGLTFTSVVDIDGDWEGNEHPISMSTTISLDSSGNFQHSGFSGERHYQNADDKLGVGHVGSLSGLGTGRLIISQDTEVAYEPTTVSGGGVTGGAAGFIFGGTLSVNASMSSWKLAPTTSLVLVSEL
ncbi:MAG: RHS repeat-associated core domain-containing protein [Opitutales bacterium]